MEEVQKQIDPEKPKVSYISPRKVSLPTRTTVPPSARRIAWSISSLVRPQLSPCFLSSSTSLRRNIPVTLSMAILCRITTLLSLLRENTEYEQFLSDIALFRKLWRVCRQRAAAAVGGGVLAILKILYQKKFALCFNQSSYVEQSLFWIFSLNFDLFISATYLNLEKLFFTKFSLYLPSLNYFYYDFVIYYAFRKSADRKTWKWG